MNDRHRLTMTALRVFDMVSVSGVFWVCIALIVHSQQRISVTHFLAIRTRISDFVTFGLTLYLCHVMLSVCGAYEPERLTNRRRQIGELLRATGLCTLCLLAVSWIFSLQMISMHFLGFFWLLSLTALCITRGAAELLLSHFSIPDRNLHFMLIVGTNPRALEFARRVRRSRGRSVRLLGFVDDSWVGITEVHKSGFSRVCDLSGLAEFLRHNVVDEVAMYLPVGPFYQHYVEVAALCEQHGIVMRFHADIFRLKTARWRAEVVDGDHYISTYHEASEGWAHGMKRALDVAIAGSLMILFLPLMCCVAVAIKINSPGPILFLQERIGLNKRRFTIWKFRTMVCNAEKLMPFLEGKNEVSGPVFKISNDPRVTSLGRWLRRTSIDELPQLINVLNGDMSLVGPRPLQVRDFLGFNEDWQRRRFSIKPGMTCLWQVNGRSGIPFDQWMLLDLQYMDEWSLWLDLKILAKTVPAVLKGAGAI